MSGLILRPACEQDTTRIVEIYNSNPAFLTAHLGRKSVDAAFLLQDHAAAESAGFLCCVLETDGGRIAGVMDYRPGPAAYLSLLMLDKAHQGQGLGMLPPVRRTHAQGRLRSRAHRRGRRL